MENQHIPLEDSFSDIISKAQSGLGLADSDIMQLTDLDRQSIRAARRGAFVEEHTRKLAKALQLRADQLCNSARKKWYPHQTSIEGLVQITMPFPESGYDDMTVNAYIVQIPGSHEAIVFDAGTRPQMILQELLDRQLQASSIFFTHGHRDHTGGCPILLDAFPKAALYAHPSEKVENTYPIENNQLFVFNNTLELSCLSTPGHSIGGISYLVKGLETPVVISGDALFAGSIGGAANAYKQAIKSIKENLFSLPDETIVCPGHGPMTSIGEEKKHNPFFIL